MSQNLPTGQTTDADKAAARLAIKKLGSEDKQALLAESVKQLGTKDKQAVIDQAGLRSPGQKSSDILWLIIVVSFATVLVGTFLSLAIGVLILNKSAASSELQIILTMFTSAVAFLAGLLTPGPSHSSQPPTP